MKKFSLAMFGVFAAFLMGCDAAENLVDCNQICNRYKTCYDKSYDTGACQTKCRNNANSDTSYMAKSGKCQACMDDKSCASAAFSCPDCLGIVP